MHPQGVRRWAPGSFAATLPLRSEIHRVLMFAGSLFAVFMLMSCSPGGGSSGSQTFTVGGSITGAANSVVDSDVNDPNAPYASNDDAIEHAQALGNPGVVGGFVSAIGTGRAGDRFASAFDKSDLFTVKIAAGQSITLAMGASPVDADLDLRLYDSTGVLVDSSVGTGSTESIPIAIAGTYLVEVFAASGISTYTLSIGVAPLVATVHDLNTTSEFIPGEVIVRFKDTLLSASAHAESPPARAAVLGMLAKAGGPKRAMLLGLGTGSTRAQALTALGAVSYTHLTLPTKRIV